MSNNNEEQQQQPQQNGLSVLRSALLDIEPLERYLLRLVALPLSSSNSHYFLAAKEEWWLAALTVVSLFQEKGATNNNNNGAIISPAARILGIPRLGTAAHVWLLLTALSRPLYECLHQWYYRQVRHYYDTTTATDSINNNNATNDTTTMEETGRCRQLRTARRILVWVDRWGPLVRLSWVLATCRGLTTTSSQSSTTTTTAAAAANSNHKKLHVDYAHRRWLYEQGIGNLQLWLGGLMLIPKEQVWQPIWNKAKQLLLMVVNNKPSSSSSQSDDHAAVSCPYCQRDPPRVPVRSTDCQHVYCYACLCRNMNTNNNHPSSCPICHQVIRTIAAATVVS